MLSKCRGSRASRATFKSIRQRIVCAAVTSTPRTSDQRFATCSNSSIGWPYSRRRQVTTPAACSSSSSAFIAGEPARSLITQFPDQAALSWVQWVGGPSPVGLVGTSPGPDHRLGRRQRSDLMTVQEEDQAHPLDAAPGRAAVTAEQLPVPPAERGRLGAPALQKALGVEDQLLPSVLRVAARGRCVPQECDTSNPPGRSPVRCRDKAGMQALKPLACGSLDTRPAI